MKYLKKFNEDVEYLDSEDMKDIFLELSDQGFIITFDYERGMIGYFLTIFKGDSNYPEDEFKWHDIKEYVFRLLDYVGLEAEVVFYEGAENKSYRLQNFTEDKCRLSDDRLMTYFKLDFDEDELIDKFHMRVEDIYHSMNESFEDFDNYMEYQELVDTLQGEIFDDRYIHFMENGSGFDAGIFWTYSTEYDKNKISCLHIFNIKTKEERDKIVKELKSLRGIIRGRTGLEYKIEMRYIDDEEGFTIKRNYYLNIEIIPKDDWYVINRIRPKPKRI